MDRQSQQMLSQSTWKVWHAIAQLLNSRTIVRKVSEIKLETAERFRIFLILLKEAALHQRGCWTVRSNFWETNYFITWNCCYSETFAIAVQVPEISLWLRHSI